MQRVRHLLPDRSRVKASEFRFSRPRGNVGLVVLERASAAPLTVHQESVHFIMKTSVVLVLVGVFLVAPRASAQQKTVTGSVTSEHGAPLVGVSIVIIGSNTGQSSNHEVNSN